MCSHPCICRHSDGKVHIKWTHVQTQNGAHPATSGLAAQVQVKPANPHLGDASEQVRAPVVGCQYWLRFACLPGLLQHRTLPMQVLSFSLSKCHKTEVLRILLGMFSFCPHTLCTRHCTIWVEQLLFLIPPRQLLFITNWNTFCLDKNICVVCIVGRASPTLAQRPWLN